MKRFLVISILLLVAGIIIKAPFSTVSYGPGVIAPDAPEQHDTSETTFWYGDIGVIPQVTFDVEAKVLSKKKLFI